MALTPSPYQSAIYQWVEHGTGSCVVIAVAGSGKTHSIIEALQHIPRTHSVRLFAFNRAIAETLKGRVRLPNVDVSTYHSAGYRAILRELNAKVDTDRNKMRDLLREHLEDGDRRAYGEELLRLVGLAKSEGLGVLRPDEPEKWRDLIEHHDLDFDYAVPPGIKDDETFRQAFAQEQWRVIELGRQLLNASNHTAKLPFEWRIDFDDQLYLPILWDLSLQQYEWVLVDEAQDTNAIQREFIRRSLKPGGRVLAVGDKKQAIYGWRGASHDAMDLIQHEFNAAELPLSVCYRCGRAIVERARQLVPQIEAAPDAWEGKVVDDAPEEILETLPPDAAILCRNNAPLVKRAYALIAKGIPCQITGRDVGDGLKKLIYKLRVTTVDELGSKLVEYEKRETKRHRQLKQEGKAQGVVDRVACLRTIMENLPEDGQTIDGMVEAIEGLFGDPRRDRLTLSTIHKAKGQEWPIVALIARYLIPSLYATKDWQLLQEDNLLYVATTRARETLYIMDDKPAWLKKKEAREQDEAEERATAGTQEY